MANETFSPITFTRKRGDGSTATRVAHSQAEAVSLRFEGWTETKTAAAGTRPPRATDSSPAKTADDK